jgi:CheY-like chemotaxis protein
VEARTALEESLSRVIERCQEARLLPEGDSLRATMIAWASLQGIALLLLDEVLELAGIETTADEAADLATEALVGAPHSVITGAALCLIEAQRQKPQALERAEVSERLSPLASADIGMWSLGPDSPPHEPEPSAPEAGALQPALRRAMAARAAVRGARILWIDDHPEWIEWETEMLDRLEMDVTTTSDTGSALELLAAEPFDLILSDIARGSRDDEGVAALPALRAVAPHTPVIFYVGRVRQQRGRPAGSDGITDQPDELLHLVLDVLERRRI